MKRKIDEAEAKMLLMDRPAYTVEQWSFRNLGEEASEATVRRILDSEFGPKSYYVEGRRMIRHEDEVAWRERLANPTGDMAEWLARKKQERIDKGRNARRVAVENMANRRAQIA